MNIKYIFLVDHFTYVLKCKRKCPKTLGSLNGEVYEDFLASHYNYLQYAYFKSKCIFLSHPVTKCIWWQFGEYFLLIFNYRGTTSCSMPGSCKLSIIASWWWKHVGKYEVLPSSSKSPRWFLYSKRGKYLYTSIFLKLIFFQ